MKLSEVKEIIKLISDTKSNETSDALIQIAFKSLQNQLETVQADSLKDISELKEDMVKLAEQVNVLGTKVNQFIKYSTNDKSPKDDYFGVR